MIFEADGTFSVTWTPFEVYKDYWGMYTFDLATGRIQLTIVGGNFIPEDFSGNGAFSVKDSALHLDRLWLGTHFQDPGPEHCGHRFRSR